MQIERVCDNILTSFLVQSVRAVLTTVDLGAGESGQILMFCVWCLFFVP